MTSSLFTVCLWIQAVDHGIPPYGVGAASVREKCLYAHGPELSVAPCRGVHQLDQLQTVQVMGVDVGNQLAA